jgi:hypothetical protein
MNKSIFGRGYRNKISESGDVCHIPPIKRTQENVSLLNILVRNGYGRLTHDFGVPYKIYWNKLQIVDDGIMLLDNVGAGRYQKICEWIAWLEKEHPEILSTQQMAPADEAPCNDNFHYHQSLKGHKFCCECGKPIRR